LPGLTGGDERELLGAVEAPGLGPRDHRGRVDRGRAGELHRHRVDPVLGEGLDARPPFEERRPGRGDISTDGRRRAEPGDDDTYPVFTHVELLADRGGGPSGGAAWGLRGPPPAARGTRWHREGPCRRRAADRARGRP